MLEKKWNKTLTIRIFGNVQSTEKAKMVILKRAVKLKKIFKELFAFCKWEKTIFRAMMYDIYKFKIYYTNTIGIQRVHIQSPHNGCILCTYGCLYALKVINKLSVNWPWQKIFHTFFDKLLFYVLKYFVFKVIQIILILREFPNTVFVIRALFKSMFRLSLVCTTPVVAARMLSVFYG